jgi:sRNA-binding protein
MSHISSNQPFKTVARKFTPRKKVPSTNKYKLAFRELEKKLPRLLSLYRPKPLEAGIREKLISLDLGLSNKTIRNALKFYCNSHQYLKCIIEGKPRVDVNGKRTSVLVTKEEQLSAIHRCKELFSRVKENNRKKHKKTDDQNNSGLSTPSVTVKKKRTFTLRHDS